MKGPIVPEPLQYDVMDPVDRFPLLLPRFPALLMDAPMLAMFRAPDRRRAPPTCRLPEFDWVTEAIVPPTLRLDPTYTFPAFDITPWTVRLLLMVSDVKTVTLEYW